MSPHPGGSAPPRSIRSSAERVRTVPGAGGHGVLAFGGSPGCPSARGRSAASIRRIAVAGVGQLVDALLQCCSRSSGAQERPRSNDPGRIAKSASRKPPPSDTTSTIEFSCEPQHFGDRLEIAPGLERQGHFGCQSKSEQSSGPSRRYSNTKRGSH